MALRIAGIVLALAIGLLAAAYAFRYELHEAGIEYEREQAQLVKREITVDGMPIVLLESPRQEGQPSLVLVHGFGASKDNWLRFAAQLTPDFHVVVPDLPGHGESVKEMDLDYDIDDQVGYLKSILEAVGVEKAHFAGNSMGGAIISLYGARHPEQVQSVFLINPAGVYEYESELAKRLKQGEENPLIVSETNSFNDLLEFALEEPPFVPWPITSVLEEKAIERKPINDKIFDDLRGDHDYDFREALTSIQAPTIVLWGDKDRVINYRNAEVFESLIPNAEKTIFKDIGHAPMVEVPERTANVFRDLAGRTGKTETAGR